jgi:hypothetical protein
VCVCVCVCVCVYAYRRRHHRDGSVTIRAHDGAALLQLQQEDASASARTLTQDSEGLDFARTQAMEMARHHYKNALARKQDLERKHDAEIEGRRQQAEYASGMQRQMRQELEKDRASFLKVC